MKNISRSIIFIFLLVFIFFIIIYYFYNIKIISNFENLDNINNKQPITIDVIHLKNKYEKKKGLMFVKNMDFNKGALFEYKNYGKHCVWMKNTFIPLEIIYLDEYFRVVELIKNMIPHDLETKCNKKKAKHFIEVNKGFIDKKNIKINDKININIINKI